MVALPASALDPDEPMEAPDPLLRRPPNAGSPEQF